MVAKVKVKEIKVELEHQRCDKMFTPIVNTTNVVCDLIAIIERFRFHGVSIAHPRVKKKIFLVAPKHSNEWVKLFKLVRSV